ncbi:MAG TPA: prolyl oligopeptidase family serine peptidase [Acidimicrobiales bacterium]|nr:prolyl oligopeptidase family serine peptidase [Acidimicrobiales bacterium]
MTTESDSVPSFPRQQARTRRFSLGRPRDIRVAADGSRITYLRSRAGDDPINCVWVIDVDPFAERLVADPRQLTSAAIEDLPIEERARRERARESAGGVVAYGTDRLLTTATFAIGGELFRADLVSGSSTTIPAPGPVVDPRPDPTGARVAYVCDGRLHVVHRGGRDEVVTPSEEGDAEVTWGLAEFVAAEEMGRSRGYWWSPSGDAVAVARVDIAGVEKWHLSDPTEPSRAPVVVAYPAAGTANADVSLHVVWLDGATVEVAWDRARYPYLARVNWAEGSPLTLLVQSRDQRHAQVLVVDPHTGTTEVRREDHDDAWLDLVPGVPAWTAAGELVTAAHVNDTMRLLVDGRPVTPEGVEVMGVISTETDLVYAGSEDPAEVQVWRGASPLTSGAGLHGAVLAGDVTIMSSTDLTTFGSRVTVHRAGQPLGEIQTVAETPVVSPEVSFLRAGNRHIETAVLFPTGADDTAKLPVLLDPYGGPGHQRVVRARNAYLESQWFADQGFAVLIADGRGTGGRGRAWDRAVHLDLAGPALDDQVAALQAAADKHPRLDLERVAIRGWSFGGYLAALAVLRRPDVFHAAVAGAPVTDWRLYDTHYTERYLGHPDEEPDAYGRSSILDDASKLSRPLLLIHGLADDNVVVAHTLRLSCALFESGRDHTVMPLAGISHMTPQEVVAENLLLLQVRFLRDALRTDE